ncbi:MAG: bifunctional 3-demethylubiquinol 3-O-methyltransferase/2-polyprenyl-6-hydroxyphenol methylase [Gammaproteobacteria bacterium RIFCSPHIGHO2_12_FULL_41_20]|nr:MAG: bifunctional 3-demethylubiquinol 3-O-methyltransferase/2-polyprenyl-6-hydroxyphenol methylase [Gammaproteobacteria bacterium RIFCSPHIGHO2_12_FULL_41_20]
MQQNVDQQEIEKFARLAAQWWDPNGDLKTLHQINPIRLSYILEKTPLKNQTILDVGCGGGILAESLAHHGARVTGIDMNAAAINVANLHQKANMGIEYLTITAEALTLERPAAYDIVTCFELLEHVPHPISIIKACYSIAKPGGHIFFSTLNRNIKSYLFAIIGAEYCLKLLPKNTHDFSKFIRPSEIATWIRDAGLQLNEFKGISYNIITQQFHLTNSISVNYLCHAKRP